MACTVAQYTVVTPGFSNHAPPSQLSKAILGDKAPVIKHILCQSIKLSEWKLKITKLTEIVTVWLNFKVSSFKVCFLHHDSVTWLWVVKLLSWQYTAYTCTIIKFIGSCVKEYSVILTGSFYDINQKILRQKGYFRNFSWFSFSVCQLCMNMYISTAP